MKGNMADKAESKNKPPVKKFRVGNVSANIWERETEAGTFYNVSFERSYKATDEQTGKEEIRSSNSFGIEDFGSLELVAGMAKKHLIAAVTSQQQ